MSLDAISIFSQAFCPSDVEFFNTESENNVYVIVRHRILFLDSVFLYNMKFMSRLSISLFYMMKCHLITIADHHKFILAVDHLITCSQLLYKIVE